MNYRLLLVDEPVFLAVRVGDAVLVEAPGRDWWIGHVIHRQGSARCDGNGFFQIACVDTGVVRTINANCVTAIIERPVGGAAFRGHQEGESTEPAMPVVAGSGKEAFEIGRALFPGCRLAGVAREEEGDDGLGD